MKKLWMALALLVLLTGCNKDDIDDLKGKYDQLSKEQQVLKEAQKQQAEQLKNYETLLNAVQNKVSVKEVERTTNGYKVAFSDGSSIELNHGETPSVVLGDNGNWWLNGEDSGVKAEGKDGENGASAPAITDISVVDGQVIFTFSNGRDMVVPMEDNTSADYTDGFFIVNEGWFGHEDGSVNFYRYGASDVETGLFEGANVGKKLGTTTMFAGIYNQRMYLISKQGPLVVVDPKTMVEIDRIENFNSQATDARAFCGVSADVGLVSTVEGIYRLNLNPLSLGEKIEGISGQVGEMLAYRDHVFVVASDNIYAINTETWAIDQTYNQGRGGFAVSRDGMIWSALEDKLLKINPYTLALETVDLPEGVTVFHNAWAWTPSSLSASSQENALYFFSERKVYKYVIGDINSLSSPLCTLPSGRMIYGAGLRVHPQTNQVIVTTIGGYGTAAAKNNLYFVDGTTGSLKKELYFEHYWFPSLIVFPEN